MGDLINILALAFLGGVVALAGGVVFLLKKNWSEWLSSYSIPFAAGVLLTVSLMGLLPEAVDVYGEGAFMIALLAFLAAYLFENSFFDIHHHSHDCKHGLMRYRAAIPLVIIGDTIHNFIDGVTIAAAYMISPGLGVVTTASTFLHEVPHEIGDFGILLGAGWKRRDVLMINIFSSLFTVLGAIMVFFWMNDPQIIGILLAISAGLFLYLGSSDFLPHINSGEIGKKQAIIALLVGVLAMFLTIKLVPHSHDEENNQDEKVQETIALLE